jgi:hypothetical protein
MGLKRIDSEKLLSLTAMIISIGTLMVFLYQTNLIRKQQYMSVYPYLSVGNYGSNTENYKYILSNNGIGPAIIKSVTVKLKGGNEYKDILPYVKESVLKTDTLGYSHSNISIGNLIPANGEIVIIQTSDNKIKTSKRLNEILNKQELLISIEYESIYGERWEITNESSIPRKKE